METDYFSFSALTLDSNSAALSSPVYVPPRACVFGEERGLHFWTAAGNRAYTDLGID